MSATFQRVFCCCGKVASGHGRVHVESRPVGVSIAVEVSFLPVVTFEIVSLVLCAFLAWPSGEGPAPVNTENLGYTVLRIEIVNYPFHTSSLCLQENLLCSVLPSDFVGK